jgi:hypothetical protein
MRIAAAVVTAAAVVVPAASPAQAAPVPSSTRTFGTAIDAPATWERESGCDPTEKKGPRRLRKLLTATYGPVPSNISRACSRSDSGHEEGRALDWMVNVRVPEQKEMAESYLSWLSAPDEFGNPAAMARRLGISYVIWNNGMWRPASGTWTPYSDCTKRKKRFKKYDNTCHRNHVHTSFSWDGALGRTSFYTGYVACPPPTTEPWVPALLPAAPGTVPVAPVRVLGTRRGLGLPAGACRVHPDVRMDLGVLGATGLPATGVAAVTLRVTVTRPDAATELRVWTGGTAAPLAPALTAERKQTAASTVTVPVGPDGLVSLELRGGMGHLAVDVVGYSVVATV